MNTVITGTIKELAGTLAINGIVLNQPELSIHTRMYNGVSCRKVGTVKPDGGGKGKPATVWEIDTNFNVTLAAVVVDGETIEA